MKIKIKDHEIELIYCERMMIKFENMYKHTFTMDELTSRNAMADLIYCSVCAAIEHHSQRDKHVGFTLTRDEFDDWYDDNSTIVTYDFTQWFTKEVQAQMDKLNAHIKDQKESENVKEQDPKK